MSTTIDDGTAEVTQPYDGLVAEAFPVIAPPSLVLDDEEEHVARLAASAVSSVMEVGCGYGRVLSHLTRLGFQAWGIDISRDMIERGRQMAAELGLDTKMLQVGDIRNFRDDRKHDAVIATDGTLSLVGSESGLAAALRSCRAALHDSGLLLATLLEGEKATSHALAARMMVEADDGCLFVLEEAAIPTANPFAERILKRLTKFSAEGVELRSSTAVHTRLLPSRDMLADLLSAAGFTGSSRFVVNGPAGKVFTRRFSLRL